jgi:ubiquinone/menaquinone biosynthesis C-methylase UbiE
MSPIEHDIMRAVEDQYWWYGALRRHVVDSIEPANPVFGLLDAGCGTGGTLEAVRRKFPQAELTGFDNSEYAIGLTQARNTGARLLPASVHELPFPEGSFDFVLSIDVWSHAGIDDALAAHEAYRVLKPGGKLIINLAAFKWLKGAHDHATGVARRYTRRDVRALLEGANFTIDRITYWNASLIGPVALVRWLSRRKIREEKTRSDFRPLPAFVNSSLREMATLELKASRYLSLPFGTSVFAVARKHG